MKNEEIVRALREHAEWAQANEWETPITLSDDLAAAADLIESLTACCARCAEEIAVAQERQRWIPVEERLPEDRSDVLVVAYWHERWGVYMGWCAPKRSEWSVHIGIGDRNDVAVTYWMPLPEGPEEER